MFRFITKQPFWVNVLAAISFLVLLLFSVLWMLGFITRHGQFEQVPAVVGQPVERAIEALEAKGFSVNIQDSIWEADKTPGTVLKQMPDSGQLVKAKRTIYLSINRTNPPQIEMPKLVGLTFRNAMIYIRQLGLVLGDTTRKPDIAKDAVLEQLYNGNPIAAGTPIYQGSVVSLVLGNGLGNTIMEVPQLVGLTMEEARALLRSYNLNMGAMVVESDVRDTARAFVIRQSPATKSSLPDGGYQRNNIRPGQAIDIWLGGTRIDPAELDADTTAMTDGN